MSIFVHKFNLRIFKRFVESSSFGGFILILCVILSLALANSSMGKQFGDLLATPLGKDVFGLTLRYPVQLWINDGLMAIFFLFVGLEIKRELVEGELSSVRRATLPVFAAIGGAVLPALIFYSLNSGRVSASGWGIPMATDIAFALAILGMVKTAPPSLKIFLAALAIVDDLIAILVIAIFYSEEIHFSYLLWGLGILLVLFVFNRLRIKSLWFYLLPGIVIWYCIHHSGIHATIAGVLVAITIPTTRDEVESPLEKLEHALSRPVNYLIMPIFALANTNIELSGDMFGELGTPLGLGIILGLLIGKPLGIFVTSIIVVKARIGQLPRKAGWLHVLGLGVLGGIGFTMSIFVALLSFSLPSMQEEAKFAVLLTSVVAGILGYIILSLSTRKTEVAETDLQESED